MAFQWSYLLLLFLAVYLGLPAPPLPDSALSHSRLGNYFWFDSSVSGEKHRIFFIDTTGDGPPNRTIVLLHGFPIGSMDWNLMMPGLRTMFGRIIVPEQLGFGFSDKPAFHSYTMNEQAEIFESLLIHLGVTHAHVLSHDTGALVGQQMVVRYNARHTALGDNNPLDLITFTSVNGPLYLGLDNQLALQYVIHLPVVGYVLSFFGSEGLLRFNLRAMFGRDDMGEDFYKLANAMLQHGDGHLAQSRIFHYMKEREWYEARWIAALRDTDIPVSYIYGPADFFHLRSGFERYKSEVPKTYAAELAGHIGHTPLWEDANSTVNAYRDFLIQYDML